MKNILRYCFVGFVFICLYSYSAIAQTPATDMNWNLIWQDQFSSGPYVSQSKWKFIHADQWDTSNIALKSRRDSEHVIDSGILNLYIIEKDTTIKFPLTDSVGNYLLDSIGQIQFWYKHVKYMCAEVAADTFFRYGFF